MRTERSRGEFCHPLEEEDADAIDERGSFAADRIPLVYLNAPARLDLQKPVATSETDWRRTVNDAGLILDALAAEAATLQWSAGELFDLPRNGRPGGLVWLLKGVRVEALGADYISLSDGCVIENQRFRGAQE